MKTKKLFLAYAAAMLMFAPIVSQADFASPSQELFAAAPSPTATESIKDQKEATTETAAHKGEEQKELRKAESKQREEELRQAEKK